MNKIYFGDILDNTHAAGQRKNCTQVISELRVACKSLKTVTTKKKDFSLLLSLHLLSRFHSFDSRSFHAFFTVPIEESHTWLLDLRLSKIMSGKHSEESRKDHYEVLNTIGQGMEASLPLSFHLNVHCILHFVCIGSFGKVCKIKRKSDGKVLVWKEMNYGKMSSKEKELVVGEVNILRDLKNPFIVKYYDRIIDREATKLYIVMVIHHMDINQNTLKS